MTPIECAATTSDAELRDLDALRLILEARLEILRYQEARLWEGVRRAESRRRDIEIESFALAIDTPRVGRDPGLAEGWRYARKCETCGRFYPMPGGSHGCRRHCDECRPLAKRLRNARSVRAYREKKRTEYGCSIYLHKKTLSEKALSAQKEG